MKQTGERLLSATLLVSTVAIAVAVIHREFFATASGAQPPQSEFVTDWREAITAGRHVFGDVNAPVTIVEFADLQCPFCRQFNEVIRRVHAEFPSEVAYFFVHDPLAYHPFAMPGARAAECAGRQGRLGAFIDAVYDRQDSLGKKTWSEFARTANVPNQQRFLVCLGESGDVAAIRTGMNLSKLMAPTGTPTIMLNGWRYGVPPADTELVRAIRDLLAGRKPYPAFPVGH